MDVMKVEEGRRNWSKVVGRGVLAKQEAGQQDDFGGGQDRQVNGREEVTCSSRRTSQLRAEPRARTIISAVAARPSRRRTSTPQPVRRLWKRGDLTFDAADCVWEERERDCTSSSWHLTATSPSSTIRNKHYGHGMESIWNYYTKSCERNQPPTHFYRSAFAMAFEVSIET